MNVELVGKNGFKVTDEIKDYAQSKLLRVDNFFTKGVVEKARVVLKVYPGHHKVEITIPTKNLLLRAEVNDKDIYAAIDKAVDKLLAQVHRHKDKVKQKLEKEGIKQVFSTDVDIQDLEKEVIVSQLVRNKRIKLVPMSSEEALTQMEMLGHSFFVFINNKTNAVSVIYRREDGDYSIIETNN